MNFQVFRDFFDFNFLDRVNNEKSIFMALAGVMMVSSAAHAISVTGEAGEHYTNLGVGFGTESTGLAFRVTGCTAITTATPRV